jgi:hypothetical protein
MYGQNEDSIQQKERLMAEETGEITADQLLAAAQEHDAAVEAGETPEVQVLTEEPEPEETPPPELPQEDGGEEVSPPDQDAEISSSLKEEQPGKVADKKQSKYAKNQARLEKSWTGVNEAKERNKQDAAQLQQQAQSLETQRQQMITQQGYRDEHGHTADDYEVAAKGFEDDGDINLAQSARAKAKELGVNENHAKASASQAQYQQAWEAKRQELMTRNPELNDMSNPLTQKAQAMLQNNPSLTASPDGMEMAVKMAKLEMKSGNTEESATKLLELQQKYNKLEKKTSVQGGFTGEKLNGAKGFEDMDDSEQEKFLRQAAMVHDDSL